MQSADQRPDTRQASRVVIVGAGFGGLEAAKRLGEAGIAVTVIDRHNHHLFQPLLYQVATAALSAPDVAEPIRKILRPYRSVEVLYGNVAAIDTGARQVRLSSGESVAYDQLILAAGARTGYFGRDEWASLAPGLKSIEDARTIRSRLLLAFEQAERTADETTRQRMMTIAVIGGGPTGVEIAGSIAELSRYTLARDFRRIRPETTTVHLFEGGPRLLPAFSEELSDYALRRLVRLGVKVEFNSKVERIGEGELGIAGQTVPVGLVIWAAGVSPSPLARELGAETDKAGRVIVTPALQVPGLPGTYAIGDIAHCPGEDGLPLPGLAQVAKQQGDHLGRALAAVKNGAAIEPFVYRSRGNTAIVGRHAAVFESGRFKLKGWSAWIFWALIHVYLLVGFQHRIMVSIQWLWRYLTYERGARLISSDEGYPTADNHEREPAREAGTTRPIAGGA